MTRRVGWWVLLVLALVAAARTLLPPAAGVVVGPVAAAALLAVARRAGLSWSQLGLGRDELPTGLRWSAGLVGLVAVGYALVWLVPALRPALLDDRYRLALPAALVTALVVVPLGTVLVEEVAFRGVLWSAVDVDRGATAATVVTSLLFGLWHVLPSLRLAATNPGVEDVTGGGTTGGLLAVTGAVLFTTLAGVVLAELRRRSGSLLPPFALHWAVNGLGVLLVALAWDSAGL